jgi:hypothetical protein
VWHHKLEGNKDTKVGSLRVEVIDDGQKKSKIDDEKLCTAQGDQIGRIFLIWAIFLHLGGFSPFGRFFVIWAN